MSPLDEAVLLTLKASGEPIGSADLVALLDCCEQNDMSKSLYRLRKSGAIEVVDAVRANGNGKPYPRYAPTLPERVAEAEDPADPEAALDASEPCEAPTVTAVKFNRADDIEAGLFDFCEAIREPEGDPICRAIDRLPLGLIHRGMERAARLRHLARRLENIGPDVAADLCETAAIIEERSA